MRGSVKYGVAVDDFYSALLSAPADHGALVGV
jgi:hypothetical protein